MLTPRRVPVVCALFSASLLLLAGCDASGGDGGDAAAAMPDASAPVEAGGSGQERPTARFGSRYEFDSGLAVTVSKPTSFQPGTSAYPHAEHAVAFQLTVRNDSDHRYRISNMNVTVTADSSKASPITDRTQGYTGLADSEDGLPSDEQKQLSLAFAVAEQPGGLSLTIEPNQDDTSGVTYVGSGSTSSVRAR